MVGAALPPRGCGVLGGPPVTLAAAEAAMACLAVDPAILLVVVGVLTFLITFCGCVGSLRENICLLQTVSPRARRVPLGCPPRPGVGPRCLCCGPPRHHLPLAHSSPSA